MGAKADARWAQVGGNPEDHLYYADIREADGRPVEIVTGSSVAIVTAKARLYGVVDFRDEGSER